MTVWSALSSAVRLSSSRYQPPRLSRPGCSAAGTGGLSRARVQPPSVLLGPAPYAVTVRPVLARAGIAGRRHRGDREAVEVDPAGVAGVLDDRDGVGAGREVHRDAAVDQVSHEPVGGRLSCGPGGAVDAGRQRPGGGLAVAADRVGVADGEAVRAGRRYGRDVLLDAAAGALEPGDEPVAGVAGVVIRRPGVRPDQRVLRFAERGRSRSTRERSASLSCRWWSARRTGWRP